MITEDFSRCTKKNPSKSGWVKYDILLLCPGFVLEFEMIYSKTKTNVTLKLAVLQQSFCFLFKKYNKLLCLWQKNNDFSTDY
jgi:hypothetical protein